MASKPHENPIILAIAAGLISGGGIGGGAAYLTGGNDDASLTLAITEALEPLEDRISAMENTTDEEHNRSHFIIGCRLKLIPECLPDDEDSDN